MVLFIIFKLVFTKNLIFDTIIFFICSNVSNHYILMKTKFITLLLFVVGLTAQSQTTAIPDVNFEQVLINLGIDSDGTINGQILTADALQVTHLYITSSSPNSFIQDVTGIEAFVNN